MTEPLYIFVGYDRREHEAYEVCKYSIESRSSIPVQVVPLKQMELQRLGAYDRPFYIADSGQMIDERDGRPFSTEFTFTRFLTPSLARSVAAHRWAIFCDCDFLYRRDVAELMKLADPQYAVMCVKHKHAPKETIKMDDKVQAVYNRKNWSSLILWNLNHASNLNLTNWDVNNQSGRWLHAFSWLEDNEIGSIPEEWNWLEGHSSSEIDPAIVHYTRGGPWFENYQDVAYAKDWLQERAKLLSARENPMA